MNASPSDEKMKRDIWFAILVLVVLLALLMGIKFLSPGGAEYACGVHRDTPVKECEACYPLPIPSSAKSPVTETRIRESYKPGTLYIQTANVECVSRGTYKRWGIKTVQDTRFYSRMSVERQLMRQEGETVVMQIRFAENFMVGIFTDVKTAKTNLSPNLQVVLNGIAAVSLLAGQPEIPAMLTWLPVAQKVIDKFLDNPLFKTAIGPLLASANAKMFNTFGELQGKKFEITWEQGKGVTNVKELGCTINAREKQYLYSLSIIPDVWMFPDIDKKPGEQWKVDAGDFVPFLDSSVNAKVTGSVTLQREPDEPGDKSDTKNAVFSVTGGSLVFDRASGKQGAKGFTFARWTPKGKCKYDFSQGIFIEGKLVGDMVMQNKGLDLFIFEMEHTEKPEFQMQFNGETRPVEKEKKP